MKRVCIRREVMNGKQQRHDANNQSNGLCRIS